MNKMQESPTEDPSVFHLTKGSSGQYADLLSLYFDLSNARKYALLTVDCCNRLNVMHGNYSSNQNEEYNAIKLIASASFAAMIISYGRAFSSGKSETPKARRRSLRNLEKQLPKDMQDTSKRIINTRNEHIAHSVDKSRENVKVTGLLDHNGAPESIRALTSFESIDQALAERTVDTTGRLIEILKQHIDVEEKIVLSDWKTIHK